MEASLAAPSQRTEMIEQLFEKVEAESERRRQEAEEAEDTMPTPTASLSSAAQVKQRRRGSVSVSRIIQPLELASAPSTSSSPSNRPSRSPSLVQRSNRTSFYQVQTTISGSSQTPVNGSADSLASNSSYDSSKHIEDQENAFSIVTEAPTGSTVSKAIARRLSRARTRSRDILSITSPTASVVIGVAVSETTVDHGHAENGEHELQSSASVYTGHVAAPLRTQKSSPGMRSPAAESGWISKAKDLTSKFKRRSVAALT